LITPSGDVTARGKSHQRGNSREHSITDEISAAVVEVASVAELETNETQIDQDIRMKITELMPDIPELSQDQWT
jgi:hypothetical protein